MLSLDSATISELYAAIDANLVTHMSWVQARLPGARVIETPDLVLVDSGFATDTFNVICRARLTPNALQPRIAEALAFFAQVGRPFSWWVGPSDQPENLGQALSQAGLVAAEEELGMVASLAELVPAETALQGLRIERVTHPNQVADFAHICVSDPAVLAYYAAAAPLILQPDSPLHLYVGYLGERPVASAELCLAGGVAGLYNICTLEAERRKGFGTALTVRPLLDAAARGVKTAVLQASVEGQRVYTRVGFRSSGHYVEYHPAT
jgi:ribosomal protein S18 acetylase RimI-like enzyme